MSNLSSSDSHANRLSIIRALNGAESAGMCRCPAHDDHNPSLHVSESGGKVLVKCHARCSQQAVIDALGWHPFQRISLPARRWAPPCR